MFVKKTKIVLGEKNLRALMLAISFLKDFFDPYAFPICSTIKSKGDEYEVMIGFKSERISFDEKIMAYYEVEIVFSISKDKPYQVEGLIQIFVLKGLWMESSIKFYCEEDGKYTIPEETKRIIAEYYKRMEIYLPPGNKYPTI